jgi:hypothetical protein
MMAKKNITEGIDRELKLLRERSEAGGAKAGQFCDTLERVMRDLKVFDQKRHQSEQMDDDVNRRFEAMVIALEKITKILKDNGLLENPTG